MNPAFTLTFIRLGKVAPWDAVFYMTAQFAGGVLGVLAVVSVTAGSMAHPSVNYVATLPGPAGAQVAFLAEAAISFLLVMVVLFFTNRPAAVARWTGVVAGFCVACFIAFESPLSGMSMNPARSFGSALIPHLWSSLWIYFTAPLLGMLLAAEVFTLLKARVACAKYHHQNHFRCIFCEYQTSRRRRMSPNELLESKPAMVERRT
jgi:aquaporin Z